MTSACSFLDLSTCLRAQCLPVISVQPISVLLTNLEKYLGELLQEHPYSLSTDGGCDKIRPFPHFESDHVFWRPRKSCPDERHISKVQKSNFLSSFHFWFRDFPQSVWFSVNCGLFLLGTGRRMAAVELLKNSYLAIKERSALQHARTGFGGKVFSRHQQK